MEATVPLVAVAGIHLVSCMSPGPNFLISVRRGLRHSPRILLLTTLGVATGTTTWTLLGVLGFTAVILGSPGLFLALKFVGGVYLARLGLLALRSAWLGSAGIRLAAEAPAQPISGWRAYRSGLLTCLSNPKAAAYYLALFTTVLGPQTPSQVKWLLVPLLPLISFTFYTLSALALSRFRGVYARMVRGVDAVFGVVMLAVGLRIFFAGN
ncbi:LysE family translocator [Paucidesulfovibrio longus]|uniref:LysE family translocator n=1 Tax=Paucidesulfovibrio longus TaxID=889 RepID=UPI0003B34DDF|nr:LysE family transporter [Paucidesulfovibrio longus]